MTMAPEFESTEYENGITTVKGEPHYTKKYTPP